MATRFKDDPQPQRRATNVSLDATMIDDAKELGIDISRTCEEGLAKVVKAARERCWIEDNRAAIEGWNAWVAEHGLPLEKYRQF